jgi:hypothetical protein
VDVEFFTAFENNLTYHELRSVIIIPTYSKLLLSLETLKQQECIEDFHAISVLRGWLWETYYMGRQNFGTSEDYIEILKILRLFLNKIAEKYDLYFVED